METIVWIALALLVLGPIAAALVWLVTRRRVALGVLAVTVVLDVLWWIDVVLIARDYRDLDGLVDCHPYCSPEQKVAGVVVFCTPLVMAAVLAGSLAVLAVRLWRGRPGPQRGPGSGLPAASRRSAHRPRGRRTGPSRPPRCRPRAQFRRSTRPRDSQPARRSRLRRGSTG
jgi:hypothetical protein